MEETVIKALTKSKRPAGLKSGADLDIGQPDQIPQTQMEAMVQTGVPILLAVFHKTVRSITGESESAFFDISHKPIPKPSKEAKLWYTPHGVVVEQTLKKGKEVLHHFKIIPLANVADTIVK